MTYLFLALVAVPFLVCEYLFWWKAKEWRGFGVTMFFLISVLGLVTIFIVTFTNGENVAKQQVFYEANTTNYEISVDRTASYLSTEEFSNFLISGSVEKWEQASYVSERIKEWRDAVNKYNTTIASMKYFNNFIFTSVMIPDAVEDMKFLIITNENP